MYDLNDENIKKILEEMLKTGKENLKILEKTALFLIPSPEVSELEKNINNFYLENNKIENKIENINNFSPFNR